MDPNMLVIVRVLLKGGGDLQIVMPKKLGDKMMNDWLSRIWEGPSKNQVWPDVNVISNATYSTGNPEMPWAFAASEVIGIHQVPCQQQPQQAPAKDFMSSWNAGK